MRKPRGLWVSDEDAEMGWREWCSSAMPGWLRENVYEIELERGANVLVVDTLRALDCFHRKWHMTQDHRYDQTVIQWPLLALHYDGIIITPYQWDRRLDGAVSDWYYSWDCASGCIWNPRAIAAVRQIPALPTPSPEQQNELAEAARP